MELYVILIRDKIQCCTYDNIKNNDKDTKVNLF